MHFRLPTVRNKAHTKEIFSSYIQYVAKYLTFRNDILQDCHVAIYVIFKILLVFVRIICKYK